MLATGSPRVRGGEALLAEIETQARSQGITALRLDTRHELHEALRLYERLGYRSIQRYNQSVLADLWFEKTI